ncbi:hypothetical protein [Adlercreutzia sp. ZJ304]|uniref:hypothetical protein n=1 Tax=Adlercreutzia sp. ZJ304 TaxID=2709791 RepID=UPI0013EBDFB2|nr:hypothetical protein [Adlercreutzia sp. ZJ304]
MESNSSNQSFWAILKGLITLAFVVAIIVFGLSFLINNVSGGLVSFFDSLSTLDAAIVVALITGAVSIFTVVCGAIINNVLSNKHKQQEYLREHREKPYTQLVEIFYKMLESTKSGNEYTQDAILKDMMEFNQGLTLWGSSKAIQKWDEWRLISSKQLSDPYAVLHGMEKVLMQLRKDMGEKHKLKQGDLLKLFVNDYDDAVKKNTGN